MFAYYLTFLNDLNDAVSLQFYFLIVKRMKDFILNYSILKLSIDHRWLQYTVEDGLRFLLYYSKETQCNKL